MRHGAVALVLFASFAFADSAQAIVIDNFNNNGGSAIIWPTFINTPRTEIAGIGSGSMGTNREIQVVHTSGTGAVILESNTTIPGTLNFSVASNTEGSARVVWDGADTFNSGTPIESQIDYSGLGTVNLTPGFDNALRVRVVNSDSENKTLTFRFYETGTTGDDYLEGSITLNSPITTPTDIFVDFAALTKFGDTMSSNNTILQNVGAIQLLFTTTSTTGPDITIDFIDTFVIPEPSTWAMLGSVLGLAGWRFQRRRKAA